jgi:hypothetical protein
MRTVRNTKVTIMWNDAETYATIMLHSTQAQITLTKGEVQALFLAILPQYEKLVENYQREHAKSWLAD